MSAEIKIGPGTFASSSVASVSPKGPSPKSLCRSTVKVTKLFLCWVLLLLLLLLLLPLPLFWLLLEPGELPDRLLGEGRDDGVLGKGGSWRGLQREESGEKRRVIWICRAQKLAQFDRCLLELYLTVKKFALLDEPSYVP